MTWSISASGKRDDVIAQLKATTPPHDDAADHGQFVAARALMLDELVAAPIDSAASVSASGHADETTRYVSMSINTKPALGG